MITPPLTTGSGVMVILLPLPSALEPTRKLVRGFPPAPQTPVRLGVVQTERSPKPTPSAGVRTRPTPFLRSKARDHPPRSTVFLFPKNLPKKPSVKDGFQAAARRGPKFV